MKLYIAGPMRGYQDRNYPMFDRAARFLRAVGYVPVNPADRARARGIARDKDVTEEILARCLLDDFRDILDCDGIVLLLGWEKSEGARAEELIARLVRKSRFLFVADGASSTIEEIRDVAPICLEER